MKRCNPKMNQYSLDDYDFVALAKVERNKKIYQRLTILAHLKNGVSKAKISRSLFISSDQISAWLKRFNQNGIEGLKDKPRSGRPRLLESSAHETLKEKIEESQTNLPGGRLRGEDIIKLIHREWGVTYSQSGIYYLMKDIGISWISARSKHPKQDEEAQEQFKKNFQI